MSRNIVVYASDSNYVTIMATSMLSVIENNMEISNLSFAILDNGINDFNKVKIKKMCEDYNREVEFYDVNNYLNTSNITSNFNITSYSRLFIANIIDEDKVLYLDCDTIVKGSLKNLFELDLGNNLVAGVQDTVSKELRTDVGLSNNDIYINSGILLINCKLWKNENIVNKFLECIQKFNGNVPHNDQGIINNVCNRRVYLLNPKYNMIDTILFYKSKEIELLFEIPSYYDENLLISARRNPIIIHYTEAHFGRPWFENTSHPFKQEFLRYRKNLDKYWTIGQSKDSNIKIIKRKIKMILYKLLPFRIYLSINLYLRKRDS